MLKIILAKVLKFILTLTEFIANAFIPKKIFKRLFMLPLANIFCDYTIDALKDIFIFNLYEKSLIEFYDAHCLDRFFKVKKSYSQDINNRTKIVNGIVYNKKTSKDVFCKLFRRKG